MKVKHIRSALIAGALAAAGMTPAIAQAQEAAPAALAPEAPIKTKSGVLGAPAEGQAQVVFFRPSSLMGAALGCTVHEDEKQVARLGSGKYWTINATPGKHQYYTEGEVTDRLNLELEEGETYFVRCNIGMGIVAGRANLSPSDRATFAKKAKGLKLWESREEKGTDKAK